MFAEDWFAVAIRVIGVTTLISGLTWLVDGLLLKLGYFVNMETTFGYYLIYGLAQLVLGFYLARGAASLVAFCYPGGYEDDDENENESIPTT